MNLVPRIPQNNITTTNKLFSCDTSVLCFREEGKGEVVKEVWWKVFSISFCFLASHFNGRAKSNFNRGTLFMYTRTLAHPHIHTYLTQTLERERERQKGLFLFNWKEMGKFLQISNSQKVFVWAKLLLWPKDVSMCCVKSREI